MGRRRRRSSKWTSQQIEEQKRTALLLWMSNTSMAKIGEQLGMDRSTAARRVDQALDDMRPHADWQRYVAIQLAELDMSRKPLRYTINGWSPNPEKSVSTLEEVIKCIETLLKMQVHEARILGLNKVEMPAEELLLLSDEELEAIVTEWQLADAEQ